MTLAHDPSFPATKNPWGTGQFQLRIAVMTPKAWILRGRCNGISTRHTVYGPWCFSFSKWCCVAHGWLLSLLIGEASSKSLLYFGCVSVLQIFEANKIMW